MAFAVNSTLGSGNPASQVTDMVSFEGLSSLYEDNPYAIWAAVGATAAVVPLSTYLLGRPSKAPAPLLSSRDWRALPLVSSKQETHDVRRLTFALSHKQQLLGLPAGQCIKVKVANAKGIEMEQAFNPISTDDTPGEVVLLVKAYPEGHPEAAIGKALHEMHVGDKIEVKGPYGSFKYQPGKYKAIGLLAGGTGVTPMINLSHVILKNPDDKVKLRLMYAADSDKDLLMKQHLDSLAACYYGKYKAFYVVNEAPDAGHHVSMGLIDKEMVSKYLNTPPGDDVLMVICGPAAFRADMQSICNELGYTNMAVIDDL